MPDDLVLAYTGAVLNPGEPEALLAHLAPEVASLAADGWLFRNKPPAGSDPEALPHHSTVCLGHLPDDHRHLIGTTVELKVVAYGRSDKAAAVLVESPLPRLISGCGPAHVTVAIEPLAGSPVHSNQITDWTPVEPLKLRATVQEVWRPKPPKPNAHTENRTAGPRPAVGGGADLLQPAG